MKPSMKPSKDTRIVERALDKTERLLRRARRPDELPYGYGVRPKSVELIEKILGGRHGQL